MSAGIDDLRHELRDLCDGRALSSAAEEERWCLLVDGAADEIRDVITHLRARPPVVVTQPCPETTARFEELWTGVLARHAAHRSTIVRTARRLGAEVASWDHPRTLTDAQRCLERLCDKRDDAVVVPLDHRGEPIVSVRLLPWAEAVAVAEDAFRRALLDTEREKAATWAA